QTEQAIRLSEVLVNLSKELGADNIDKVIYAWMLALPVPVLQIIGSGRIERSRTTVLSEHLQLDRQQGFCIWHASM
ncbi:oxidoreductase, partial [Motilimonas sp. 1_MG-2023]|nr:oxidoreductase [Motilimonas sp. 1_MG-2023]